MVPAITAIHPKNQENFYEQYKTNPQKHKLQGIKKKLVILSANEYKKQLSIKNKENSY